MTIYDIIILVVIAGLLGWGIWDYRKRKNQRGFALTLLLTLPPILISLASLLFGLWGCHKFKEVVVDKIFGKADVIKSEVVASVESGNLIKLKAGMVKRGRRTKNCTLWGLIIPPEADTQAKENLQKMVTAGETIRIGIKEGDNGLLGLDRGDISGIPFAKNGENCCLEQLRNGLATTTVSDTTFVAAQKEAQKAHKGIWKKKTKSEETE